jgi:hypothetical protein
VIISGRYFSRSRKLQAGDTFGVRSQLEQEKRATSCVLGVMHRVPEFGYALLKEVRAPKAP